MVLDLREISTFTDFFVICSGTSEPHLKAIAGEIETRLREDHGLRPAAVDGFPASQWIVIDYLQVIVHVFHRENASSTAWKTFGATHPGWRSQAWTNDHRKQSQRLNAAPVRYRVVCLLFRGARRRRRLRSLRRNRGSRRASRPARVVSRWFRGRRRSHHFDQLNIKHEHGIWADIGPGPTLAVGEIRRNKQLIFRARLHQLESLRPTLDHPINREGCRCAALYELSNSVPLLINVPR